MTTINDLSKELGIAKRSVHYWVKKLGMSPAQAGGTDMFLITDEQADLIRSKCSKYKRAKGAVAISTLAKEIGLSRAATWNIAAKLGYTGARKERISLTILQAHEVREVARARKAKREKNI